MRQPTGFMINKIVAKLPVVVSMLAAVYTKANQAVIYTDPIC